MSRLSFTLILLVGLLTGALGALLLRPEAPTVDQTQVRALVSDMLQKQADATKPVAALDPAQVNKLVEDYLLGDPTILTRMNQRLADQKLVAQRKAQKDQLDAHRAEIYDDAGNVILGNPNGDVTLVEMFDYNCSYCRGAVPDMAALMAEDPNLKVILKEFPILTSGSVDAARVAVLVGENKKIDYWDFHQQLFAQRGEVGADQALQVAEKLGGNRVELMLDMNGKAATDALQKSYALAKSLNIGGTPTYIIGDELIPGAVPIDQLREKIANMRACGSTVCPAAS